MNPLVPTLVRWVGGLCRRLSWWPAAEYVYGRAIRLDPTSAGWHFRLGQVREHRRNWLGAERAYRSAVQLDSGCAAYHFRLGRVLERQQNFVAAEGAYSVAIRLDPARKEWHLALGEAHERNLDPLRAVEVYNQARARFGDDPQLLKRLAHAYEAAAEWRSACRILRQLLAVDKGGSETKHRLAICLDKLGRVPFEFRSGELVLAAEADPATGDTVDEATKHYETALTGQPQRVTWMHRFATRLSRRKWLYEVVRRLPSLARTYRRFARPAVRLRRLHELGLMYERQGKLHAAVKVYQSALAGLREVDAIWAHSAEPGWKFRLAYVQHQLTSSSASDPRLFRSAVVKAAEPPRREPIAEPGGFFETLITDAGLSITGFLVPGTGQRVEIYVDGWLVKSVLANERSWLRRFSFAISHSTLTEFPQRALLTVSASGRPLLSTGGGHVVEIRVPDGTGQLADLLALGYSLSKKGVLARPASDIHDRQVQYLKAYCEAKDKFEELLGKQLFLLYGTLLGCYRDGTFIAGDDDFDVSYLVDASDPVEVKRELQRAALALLRAGYDICITVTGRLFKVRFNDTWLDINALWFYKGMAWAFEAHNLARTVFEPIKSMEFLGQNVYVPNDVEAFLEDNYGASWRTPQPDFRYYRDEKRLRILRRSWLTPSEAREFARLAEAERSKVSSAGRFVGIGHQMETGFAT